MKAKIKALFYYLSLFIASCLLLVFFLGVLVKDTVLNPDYIIKQLEKNDYIEKLSDDIYDEMTNYIIQSGLEDSVLENIYTKEMVEEEVKDLVYHFYQGKEMKIDTTKIKENLEKNIISHLEQNNIKVADQKALDDFVNQILTVYSDKISFSQSLSPLQSKLGKIEKLLNVMIIAVGVLIAFLLIITKVICRRLTLPIPCFTTSFLIFIGNHWLLDKINVKHIVFWNENVTEVLKSTIWDISKLMKERAIMILIIGIVFLMIHVILLLIKKEGSRKKHD